MRPWSDELRDSCIQAALADAPGATVVHAPDAVEKILDHLAEMRMLLPPGGFASEQWRVVYIDPQNGTLVQWTHVNLGSREEAERKLRACSVHWHTARLQRRRHVLWMSGDPQPAWALAYGPWENIP